MANAPRRFALTDTNGQRILAVVPMITHLKQAGPARTEIFLVGGNSIVVQGAFEDLADELWS